jgi:hypothetical protein
MLGGTLQSAEGFDPAIDAEFVGIGNDYIHADADGKHLRLNAHGVIKYVALPSFLDPILSLRLTAIQW